MALVAERASRLVLLGSAACFLFAAACTVRSDQPPALTKDPIAFAGHGGFFDETGRQIVPTVEFVRAAQGWYRQRLLASLPQERRRMFREFEKGLAAGLEPKGQAALLIEQRNLEWLAVHSPLAREPRLLSKIRALSHRLTWELPTGDDIRQLQALRPFALDPAIKEKLARPEFAPGGNATILSVTTNKGAAYNAECAAAGVPVPPPIGQMDPAGTAGWKSEGFIPTAEQFIVGTPAEVRSYQDANGMCIALPRYSDASLSTVDLDGVICLSKTTSKACFWDNQINGVGFSFPSGTKIPIGAPDLSVNPDGLYQAGGAEIEFGSGDVCTDCHAGENPYIIHPQANLGGGNIMGSLALPTFSPQRYDPIVAASWPQNQLSHSATLVPPGCLACHAQGSAGRFPHLSNELPGYCTMVLGQAIMRTMPPGAGGTAAGNADVIAFRDWCNSAPTSGPSDRGDPHLITTNGVAYDFQAAGEFVALRNAGTGFELQTRQTPILTTFTPGPNAYTGLSSCVSLNTAAAVRVGRHRITYQPSATRPEGADRMELRIDGRPVRLAARGVNLGAGNVVAQAASGGGVDIKLADGTRLIITPSFWSSQNAWYLDIEVLNTPAREGIMGHIAGSDWLPRAPDGSSFGPKPGPLAARHVLLNEKFADAWRVTPATSLFHYAPGTSTATFTDRTWPSPRGGDCRTSTSGSALAALIRNPPDKAVGERAAQLCERLGDKAAIANCVFDVTATGHAGFAKSYLQTLQLRKQAENQ